MFCADRVVISPHLLVSLGQSEHIQYITCRILALFCVKPRILYWTWMRLEGQFRSHCSFYYEQSKFTLPIWGNDYKNCFRIYDIDIASAMKYYTSWKAVNFENSILISSPLCLSCMFPFTLPVRCAYCACNSSQNMALASQKALCWFPVVQ